MEERNRELPDECWAMIFNRIYEERDWKSFPTHRAMINQVYEGSDWESVSLVSKQFLSITNSHRVSLSVFCPSIQVLSRQFQRFPNLKKIELIHFLGDLNKAILAIARSGLNLEELDLSDNEILPTVCLEELGSKMKNMKVLKYSSSSLTDANLIIVANSFPQLEELQIRYSHSPPRVDGKIITWTDIGIGYLSSKLTRLRKLDLPRNSCISDKSLISLSLNCAFIEQLAVDYCKNLTDNGISFVMQNSNQLNSLVLCGNLFSVRVKGSAKFLRNLRSLNFRRVSISDEFLCSITEARIPLTEFTLSNCRGYTFSGLKSLIHSYQSLKTLVLQGAEYLTDEHIKQLSPFLHNLEMIWLDYCSKLSSFAVVMLIEKCPFLSRLEILGISLGREEYIYDSPTRNLAITSLNLSNGYFSSRDLRKFLKLCPNLKKLNLSQCFHREEHLDVADILEFGSGITSLDLTLCFQLKYSTKSVEISKLQRLVAQHSAIDDEVLVKIGRNCPALYHLNLEDCSYITEEGIKEVVRSCKRLKYLNLSRCPNMHSDMIEWIVSTRPSLRRLVSPSHLYPEEEQQNNFLQRACLVYRCEKPLFD